MRNVMRPEAVEPSDPESTVQPVDRSFAEATPLALTRPPPVAHYPHREMQGWLRGVFKRGRNTVALALACAWLAAPAAGQAPTAETAVAFAVVKPSTRLHFPADYGAHPDYRTEWWYVTGWLETDKGETLGFQLTFFRSRTGLHEANPSRYAPRQILFAHAALSDFRTRTLIHDERAARAGPSARFTVGETALRIGDWRLERDAHNDTYTASVSGKEFSYNMTLAPTQAAPWLQGRQGFSQKGPKQEQASHYYSRPQLKVHGTLQRAGQTTQVTGTAWLDH